MDPVFVVCYENSEADKVKYKQAIITKETVNDFVKDTELSANTLKGLFHVDVPNMAYQLPGIKEIVFCPVQECLGENNLYQIIMHVNDQHQWTREEIADWIESLPNQERFTFNG